MTKACWELGKSTTTTAENGFTLVIARDVSCQKNILDIVTDLYVEELGLNYNVNLKYKLNDQGDLVYMQSGSLHKFFICKRK